MEKLIDKLSSYNIFTNLFPGVVFCYLADRYYGSQLIQDDLVIGVFLYYFIGMGISRVGSLIVEPILEKLKVVSYASYEDYLEAVKSDPNITTLLETNNSYRSVLSLLSCLIALWVWNSLQGYCEYLGEYSQPILMAALAALFLFSYRKQTRYIKNRINHRKSRNEK